MIRKNHWYQGQKGQGRKRECSVFLRFFPESYKMMIYGRSSDLLLVYRLPMSHVRHSGQVLINKLKELTAAGTVQDLHPIPF